MEQMTHKRLKKKKYINLNRNTSNLTKKDTKRKKKKRTEIQSCGIIPRTIHSDICADGVTEVKREK